MRFASCALSVFFLFGCDSGGSVVEGRHEELRTQSRLDGKTLIRVMAANITSGNEQSYDTGEGIRIFQGVRPDLVLIQEFNFGAGTDGDFNSLVSSTFGAEYRWVRGDGSIPNGVISRWPIKEWGEWKDPVVPDRQITWARIDIPGDKDLWGVSVHYSTSSASNRSRQAVATLTGIKEKIPDGDYLVLGGDFNTSSRGEPAIQELSHMFVTNGPYPSDGRGNDRTNASRGKPYDWVLADRDLDPCEVPLVLGSSTFTDGLVVDTRVYSPLSDIAPAKQSDSASTNMQHMAVVRDFAVPTQGGSDPVDPQPPPPADPVDPTDPVEPPVSTGRVILTEVLANEPGSDIGGELVELRNDTDVEVDLTGWTIGDRSAVRHTFGGETLQPGAVIVVYGNVASGGSLGLSNSGDAVVLTDASGSVVDRFEFANAGDDGTSFIRSGDEWIGNQVPTPGE